MRERLKKENQLTLDDALRIAREVADSLSYAHARGQAATHLLVFPVALTTA